MNNYFWDSTLRKKFQTWMQTEGYASKTILVYSYSVDRIFRKFKFLSYKTNDDPVSLAQLLCKLKAVVKQLSQFESIKNHKSSHLVPSLKVFQRFIEICTQKQEDFFEEETIEKVDASTFSIVQDVLMNSFPYGYKLGSPIELLRFRRFAKEKNQKEFSISDDELESIINTSGTLVNGKVYIIPEETETWIKNKIDQIFATGTEIIFYDEFYNKHLEWFLNVKISSSDMLKSILSITYPDLVYRTNYLAKSGSKGTEISSIKNEVMRIFEDKNMLSFDELESELPYIPLQKIKFFLAYNKDFIWNSEGNYTHVSKVVFSEEDRKSIEDFVYKKCQQRGYVSLCEIPLGAIEEKNYELTASAIHNGIFEICFASNYNRMGKIITIKGVKIDARSIMKNYCQDLEKCSLEDLLFFQEELVGQKTNQTISLEAAYDVLVRISKDTFIAEKYVDFNPVKIDQAIEAFNFTDYFPLKSFTTFAGFPDCGQPWNLFLLESYCRRFSHQFRFALPSVNSLNVGVVIRKRCNLSYLDILANEVAKSTIKLEEKAISIFLFENGFIGKRTTQKVGSIIEIAKDIRESK